MKKFINIVLVLTLALCICACDNESGVVSTDTNTTSSQTENVSSSASQAESISSTYSQADGQVISTTSSTTTQTHTHTYSTATCTTPKKCSCGATSGNALGHNFTNGVCARCGAKNSNALVWTYEDGGEDYIIKTNGKERIKVPCHLGDLGIEDIPNDDYIVKRDIKRTHIKEYNGFVYFHLSYECSEEYVGNAAPSIGGNSAASGGQGFYSLRLSDGNVKYINSENNGLTYYMALGYDGNTLYFLANYGYEPGGDIYSIDLSQIGDAFIKKAKFCNRFILEPSSSKISNGILYLTYDGDEETIAISELK